MLNPKLAPISMILTNLATHAYNGEPDIFTAVTGIVERMPSFICSGWPRVPVCGQCAALGRIICFSLARKDCFLAQAMLVSPSDWTRPSKRARSGMENPVILQPLRSSHYAKILARCQLILPNRNLQELDDYRSPER